MPALSFSALLGLVLLTAPVEATERAPLPTCAVSTRHIELTEDASDKPTEVCIRPGLSLNFFFDVKLARVDVVGRERFRQIGMVDGIVTLVASEALHDGERVPMTVSFQDGAAPTSVSFVLVVHPSQAERQVDVSRRERTLASLRLGEQQARAEAQQCREAKERLQAECSGPGGLTGLIIYGWLGDEGVVARRVKRLRPRSTTPLQVQKATGYRAITHKGRERVAVEVELLNRGAVAWTPSGAALVSAGGDALTGLTVAPREPIPPGQFGRIVVELEVAEHEARGSFTLKLWTVDTEAEGVSLDGVTFP